MSSKELRQVAVISGATGGIGSAIAARLVQEGWRVFGTTTRSVESQEDLSRADGYLSLTQCRAEKVHQVRAFRQHVGMATRRLDLLVIAHGAPPCIAPAAKLMPTQFRQVLDIDVLGAYHLCQAFGAMMLRQKRGNIVLLTSMHSVGTYPQRVAYSTAKTAIVGLGRGLAVEWAAQNIQVNMIAPGQVEGGRTRGLATEAMIAAMKARTPAGQLINAQDIAETVLWLTRTPGMTGQTIILDHGWTSSLWYGTHDNPA